ncbi:hypothetical protein [Fibrobacter sp. UWB7]|nr:hypothetical protein [Fibrobacter sp. UWB7]SHM39765.1 hypothetical protein SAMN05720467_1187 [Fibrobacter sp. UWB7]
MKTTKKMAYKKPRLIAKNNPTGSFAAGCPSENYGGCISCKECERTE